MPKYIAFLVPDKAWDGIDYLYDLIELRPNNLRFALVTAKNMEQARKKYFLECLYSNLLEDDIKNIIADSLNNFLESYNEQEIVRNFGEKDGKIIWKLTLDTPDDLPISHKDAVETVNLLSEESIEKLCFSVYEYGIAVSEIKKIIK